MLLQGALWQDRLVAKLLQQVQAGRESPWYPYLQVRLRYNTFVTVRTAQLCSTHMPVCWLTEVWMTVTLRCKAWQLIYSEQHYNSMQVIPAAGALAQAAITFLDMSFLRLTPH
jgi:hypothetical protein